MSSVSGSAHGAKEGISRGVSFRPAPEALEPTGGCSKGLVTSLEEMGSDVLDLRPVGSSRLRRSLARCFR